MQGSIAQRGRPDKRRKSCDRPIRACLVKVRVIHTVLHAPPYAEEHLSGLTLEIEAVGQPPTSVGISSLSNVSSNTCRTCFYCNRTAIHLCQAVSTCLTTPAEPSLLAALRTSNPRLAGSNPAGRASKMWLFCR